VVLPGRGRRDRRRVRGGRVAEQQQVRDGYVLYGLIAVAFLIVPNVLAYGFAKEVPFPTLFRTLADLDRRWHPLVLIIVAGLSVLVVHLVAYPWP
jgi:hypothetical protein